MAATHLSYGIPDVALTRVDGGVIKPAELVGHDFVVFFCPADEQAATREIDDYRSRNEEFEKAGTWLIGVLTGDSWQQTECGGAYPPLARDSDGAAWAAFESLLDPDQRSDEGAGGTFAFARGGCLARAWAGGGHAADALHELRRRR